MNKQNTKKPIILSIVVLTIFLFTALGCNITSSSYPKEKLIESIKNLCKSEYDIDIQAKVVKKTLGVQTFVEGLINSDLTRSEEYKKVIENIFLCVRRVCLSTDANIDFFYITCVGKKLGYEAIVSGYITDLRKIMVGGISRNDYFQRMMFEIKPSSKIFGKRRIQRLISDINTKKVDKIIGNNFIRGKTTLKDISSIFFLSLLELNMKEEVNYKLVALKSMPISSHEELFYCKVKEKYTVKQGFENKNFIFPSNFLNEYLILISVENFRAAVKKIYPLFRVGGEEKADFPKEYGQYKDINNWKENDFFVENLSLPQFLAEQIAKRIKQEVNEKINKTKADSAPVQDEKKLPAVHIEGTSLDNNHTLELTFAWQKKFEELSDTNIVNMSFQVFKQVCKKYRFFNFKQIKLIDLTNDNEIGAISVDKKVFKKGNVFKEAFNLTD